jgi:subtilase family serine protease
VRSSLRKSWQILACGVAACALGGSSVVASASAASSRIRVGSAARLPAGARLGGSLAASKQLQLTVALQPRDPSGLQSFATAVSTPGSPNFRHYLSVSQFAQTYGATASQISAVQSTLRSEGLTVGAPMANHLTLSVSGTAAQVQQAFSTKLSQVTLASGRSAYANTNAPTLAPNIAGDVQGVIGLNNLVVEQPEGLAPAHSGPALRSSSKPNVVTGGPQPCSQASQTAAGNPGGYTADTIAAAYNFSAMYQAGDLGAGQTVALYELEPVNPADISAYEQCYQTAPSVSEVNVDSAPAFAAGDDDGEAALDIEQVIGLAPKANILVYQAPNTGAGAIDEYNAIVSQDQAKVVSSSWGECEADALIGGAAAVTEENTLFQEAAAQGQTIYVASGDTGSAACSQANPSDTGLSVQDPSSQPFATGVGGTTLFTVVSGNLFLWSPGDTVDQSVWNEGTPNGPGKASASTGGISLHWAMPSYQSGAASSVGVINPDSSSTPCGQAPFCREVPDVSADADPDSGYVVITSGSGGQSLGIIGGTSAAAPLWAAYTALVNDEAACRSLTIGFANPALYQIASSAYASNISDVSLANPLTGFANNDALQANGGLFPVTAGYDMTTGLGTPISPTLANSLCAVKAPVYAVTVTGPGNQSATVGKAVSVHMHAADSGGAAVFYTASGLPAGLTINAASGVISGKPRTAGTSSVGVFATDAVHNTGATRFTFKVLGNPTTSSHLQGVDKGKPKLSFTAVAGSNAPALKSVSIGLPSGLSFARKSKTLDKGLVVKSGSKRLKFKLHLSHGSLTISFKKSTRKVTVTIANPAIGVSRSLRLKALHHKVKKLTVTFRVTNTSNATTKFSTKLALKP